MATKSYLQTFLQTLNTVSEFLVLDTETTGLLSDGEVVQIAIINNQGDTLLDTLVKPSRSIPPGASNVHGITDEMVEGAATWATIAPLVSAIIEAKPLVVYNVGFDRAILYNSNAFNKLDKTDWAVTPSHWLCAMNAYAPHYGEWNNYHRNYKWQPLSTAARLMDVPVENAHSALGDCRMALGVTQALLAHYAKGAK